jgi:hypothetical protein
MRPGLVCASPLLALVVVDRMSSMYLYFLYEFLFQVSK